MLHGFRTMIEAVVAYSNVVLQHFIGATEESHDAPCVFE